MCLKEILSKGTLILIEIRKPSGNRTGEKLFANTKVIICCLFSVSKLNTSFFHIKENKYMVHLHICTKYIYIHNIHIHRIKVSVYTYHRHIVPRVLEEFILWYTHLFSNHNV